MTIVHARGARLAVNPGLPSTSSTCAKLKAAHLAAGLTLATSLLSGAALAQQSQQDVKALTGVEVTGSRIRQIDKETSLPVTVFTAKDIQETGDLTVAQFLVNLNENTFGSDVVPTSLSSGGAAGGTTVSLRGLGSERTLILLDGQRLPLDPSFTPPSVNVNIIPLAAIDRIEVLRDGASAIYGSDAIGGVVNIITKKKFDGVQLSGQYDNPTQKGGKGASASLMAGFNSEKGNAYFSYEHAQQSAITYQDRPFLKNAFSAYGDPGTIATAINHTTGVEDGNAEVPFSTCPAAPGGSTYPNSGPLSGGALCGFNIGSQAWVTASTSRDSLMGGVNYKLGYDITGFAKVLLTKSVTQAQSASAPATSGFNNAFGLPEVAYNNPNNPFPGDDLYLYYRPTENGPRHDTVNDTISDVVGGLRGEFDVFGTSEWEVAVTNSGYRQSDIGTGYGQSSAFQAAINNGSYNPFNPASTPGGASSFGYTISNNNNYDQNTVGGHVTLDNLLAYSGIGFRLPLVVGADYRDEKYAQIGDAQSQTSFSYAPNGTISGYTLSNVFGNAGGSSQGSRSEYAVYGETQLSFLQDRVNLSGALRYDKYSVGGSKTSPKVSLSVRPIESLLLRSTYSEGFRAPTLYDLFASPAQSFDAAIDTYGCAKNITTEPFPCSSGQQRQAFRVGSNALKPETSRNINAGFVFSPVHAVTLTADYYRITLTNGIATLTAQQVLNNDANCIAATGKACTDAASQGTVVRASNEAITFVYEPKANASSINTDGFDLSADYKLQAHQYGVFDFSASMTQVLSYREQLSQGGETYEEVGFLGNPSKRGELSVNWAIQRFNSTAIWHRTWSTADCDPFTARDKPAKCGTDRVSSFNDLDLQLGYNAPWKGTFNIGVRNLFNLDPPASQFKAAGTDTTGRYGVYQTGVYPMDGRVPYVSYTQRF